MKKFMTLFLTLALSLALCASAFAAGESTTVTYTGTGTEEYTVTVPANMAPGGSADVTATGTWASNRKLTVTAPSTVTLTNSLDSGTKDLAVTFAGIAKTGNNETSVSDTQTISVADISGALFGTWTGTITYTVSMSDAA